MENHPSAYALEAHSVGALEPAERETVAAHLQTCRACVQQLAALEGAAQEFRRSHPPARFFARVDRSRRRRLGTAVFVAAAASLAVLAGTALRPPEKLQARGAGGVTFFLAHRGAVEEQRAPMRVTAGDALRIEITATRRTWVSAFFLDAEGNLSWYVPAPGQTDPWVLEPGSAALPGSAVFDASLTPELLVLVQRPEPFRPAQLAQVVRAAWLSQSSAPFESGAWLPDEPGLSASLVLKQRP